MKTHIRGWLFALFFTAVSVLGAADKAAQVPGGKLYITIDYFDPIAFREFRAGEDSGQDLIMPTLKAKAGEMAQAAQLAGEMIVLNEGEKPPADAPVLRLTWGNGAVMAEYIQPGKTTYLGVVSRKALTFHPSYNEARRRVETGVNASARRDELVRVRTELELYLAFQDIAEKLNG